MNWSETKIFRAIGLSRYVKYPLLIIFYEKKSGLYNRVLYYG
jgi:hypothetical protein